MTTLTRVYLRASTNAQDAQRARAPLEAFVKEKGLIVAGWYSENVSGASLQRPELFRLISDSKPGDIVLVEQVDRLSRLSESDWKKLRAVLAEKEVRVVALDLPTSHVFTSAPTSGPDAVRAEDFTSRIFAAMNDMMLDVLAAMGRKDYTDRRRRQREGITKAKTEGRYRGRKENVERNAAIARLLANSESWSSIQRLTKCSRATVAAVAKRVRAEMQEAA